MNEAMVPRVMSDVVVQRGVPFLGSCCAAPSGVSEPNQSKEHGLPPKRATIEVCQETWTTGSKLRQDMVFERPVRLRNGVNPKGERPPLNQLRDSTTKARGFYFLEGFDSTGRFGSPSSQNGGGHDIGRPFVQWRRYRRRSARRSILCVLPQSPGLFCAKVLVRVVHHGLKPALRLCIGELAVGDPFFQGMPKEALLPRSLLSFAQVLIEKTGITAFEG